MEEFLEKYISNAPLLAVLFSYLGGVLTSFTPCLFPLIPITIGIFGARNSKSKAALLISIILYVFGMAVVYSVLGMVAALGGSFFGAVSVNPFTNIVIANICLFFSLSMFDMFVIPIPKIFQGKNVSSGKAGYFGIFLMGMLSGTVVAPCTAPVLGTLLTYIASTGSIFYGFLLMFAYSVGLGTIFIMVAMFSGFYASVKKSPKIMEYTKKFLAFLMLIMAEYFLIRAGQLWW